MVAHPRQMRTRHPLERGNPSSDAQLLFAGAVHAVFLLRKGHGDELASDITGFIAEQPQS